MKKGQKVRILRTNQIATIADIELIKKGGKVHRYCHLKTDKQPDLWMDASELGGLTERCTVVFRNEENGQELHFKATRDYRKEQLNMQLTSKNSENLKEQHGLHVQLCVTLMKGLACEADEVKE